VIAENVQLVSDNFAAASARLRPLMPVRDPLDRFLGAADAALRTLSGAARARRPAPQAPRHTPLQPEERALSAALMRVNHVGEVCAQALYQAQSLTARSDALREQMERAARDEVDHLAWTEQRLRELDDRPSLLNPIWYGGAFVIGLLAGRAGDRWSLGFVVETERQVEAHLAGHLNRLPEADRTSRAIVARMKDDEAQHARDAEAAGAVTLPAPVRWAMRGAAKVMTTTAHHL
jgi:ubiquinone biosynthesis monooxygenase Coq7